MKRLTILLILAIVLALQTAPAAAVDCFLDVPVCGQEMDQWCWAGCSQAILSYYGYEFTQTEIAQYGTEGLNEWNWLWGSSTNPTRRGIDMILDHFADIPTTPYGGPLSFPVSSDEICGLKPFVIRWGWTSGGGHFLVGHGVHDFTGDQAILYMDPWPPNVGGQHVSLFSWVVSGGSHEWTHTLTTDVVAGSVRIEVLPDGLAAPWTLDLPGGGQTSGTGDAEFLGQPAGDYTLTWGEVEGMRRPDPAVVTQTLSIIGSITFTGEYAAPFTVVTDGDVGDTGPARGAAMVDIDRDGDLDVYVVNDGTANLLLRNEAGVLTDVATGPEADAGPGSTGIFADHDADGDFDLFLARPGAADLILRGDGALGFEIDDGVMGLGDTGQAGGAGWCDYDRDGLLDLHLVVQDGGNSLYRNYGPMGAIRFFGAVSGEIADPGSGCAQAWGDYDGDGRADVYVSNRYTANRLFHNHPDLGFHDTAFSNGSGDTGNGSGVAWGDYDNDGDLDLYLANDGGFDALLRNDGGTFVAQGGGPLGDTGHGRGVVWGDFDNDGDLDIYLARYGEKDLILINDGGVFHSLPVLASEDDACGAAAGDIDGDGDLDVFVAVDGGPNRLVLNDGASGHWLHLDLRADGANHDAVGARVTLHAGSTTQLREVAFGSGYWSQDSPLVEFGLGEAAVADSIIAHWPDGQVETLHDIAADQVLVWNQGDYSGIGTPARPDVTELAPPSPNPFNPATTIAFTLADAGPVRLAVYDLAGRCVRILRDGVLASGPHAATWNGLDDAGRRVASGAYLLRLETEDGILTRKAVLTK